MKPLYRHSFDDAKRNDDISSWRESHNENIRCRDFLDKEIAEKFDGSHLPPECVGNTVKEFGFDRTMWVIANTINERTHDGRICRENRDWASGFRIPNNRSNYDFALNSHSCLVEGLANQVQRMYSEIGLFNGKHIVKSDEPQNYAGKLLILRDSVLKEECRVPENQLFLAGGGFGCDPDSSGRKASVAPEVFGQFLSDGEQTHFNRSDFVGIIADEHIPQWAKEKLEQINEQKNEPQTAAPTLNM